MTPAQSPSLSERLQAVTEALAAARTQDEVVQIILTPALQALGALAGAVLLLDPTGTCLETTAIQGYEQGVPLLWKEGPLDGTFPAGDALQRREPLFFEHQGDLVGAYPDLEARTGGVAAVAVLPMFLDGAPLGAISLDFQEPHHFTPEEQRFLQILAAQCAIALGRAQLTADLQRQVDERTEQLLTNARAQEAFVAFTEAAGTQTDVVALAQQAIAVLRTRFPDSNLSYFQYEPTTARWQAQAWSDNHTGAQVTMIRTGFPSDTPIFADVLGTRQPVFRDAWDPGQEQIEHTEEFGQGATYPLLVNGEVRGILGMAARHQIRWNSPDRALVQAVGRSLTLALERAEQTQHLETQNAELEARTRALEGFAELTRDLALEENPLNLVGRAQELMVSLIPGSISTYYELQGDRWQLRSHRGEFRHAALLAAVQRGLPRGTTINVDRPFDTREAYYQDQYDPRTTAAVQREIQVIRASAAFPIYDGEQPRGVLVVGVHEARAWTSVERAVLETIVRSLALALERAKQAGALQQQSHAVAQANEEFRRSNAELEQFAYIASHDLQAPIRGVTSFARLIEKRYGERLDERGLLYLQQIMESGEHMKRLLDDLLAFSRVHTERRPLQPTDAEAVFDVVVQRLQAETPGVIITRGELPMVLADAQQLDQLLQNLIANGLKYCRMEVTPEVHLSAERDGEFWRFAVADNGIGIEPEYFERIFEIFQRLHGRESYEGTGIGLAVCKKIVERHGGQLWLQSTFGQGSTFFFTLRAG